MGDLFQNRVVVLIEGDAANLIIGCIFVFAFLCLAIIVRGNDAQNARLIKFVAALRKSNKR